MASEFVVVYIVEQILFDVVDCFVEYHGYIVTQSGEIVLSFFDFYKKSDKVCMAFCGVRIILVWYKERINLSKKRKTFDKRTKSVYTDLAKSEEDA